MISLRSWLSKLPAVIVTASLVLALLIYVWFVKTVPLEIARVTQLSQWYGLLSLLWLYLALLLSPLYFAFPSLPGRKPVTQAVGSLVLVTFIYATLHGAFSFFGELGGFAGLGFLNTTYLVAITLSFTAWILLALVAAKYTPRLADKISPTRRRQFGQFIYVTGLLVFIHVLLLGTHFTDLSTTIPQIFFGALAILLGLLGYQLDCTLQKRSGRPPQFGLAFVGTILLVGIGLYAVYFPNATPSFNVHAQHIQLAKQAQQGTTFNFSRKVDFNSPAFSGLRGDPTKRYTVSFSHSVSPQPGQDIQLTFRIYDANTGDPVNLFTKLYGQFVHMVIVDQQLQYFNHIHPDPTGSPLQFVETVNLPHAGLYHIYLDYQPFGAIEQQQAFTVQVGDVTTAKADQPVDANLAKTVGDYTVTFKTSAPLKASEMSIGNQTITLHITRHGQPVTNLRPVLQDGHQDFGHLVLVNEQTFDYIHVHPNALTLPQPNSTSGPDITFLPLGLYGPIKPGVYRAFAQFAPDGQAMVVDFTVRIQ